jgi:hypothetical protein
MELTGAQYFDGLHYSLLIRDLWGLRFKPKDRRNMAIFLFRAVGRRKIFFCADIFLKTLEVN